MTNNHLPFDRIWEKDFVDIPSSIPEILFPLQKVGITNRPHYVKVLDPFTKEKVDLFTELKILFSLPPRCRGLHMSRVEECLIAMKSVEVLSIKEYAQRLCQLLSKTQEESNCTLELISHYEKPVSKNPSTKDSSELLKLYTYVESYNKRLKFKIGVTVPFINACPCTQRWGMRDFYRHLQEKHYKKKDIEYLLRIAPLQSHTNGGVATLLIEDNGISHSEIYGVLDRSVPIVRELLKGMDEHTIVKRAHERGQFCEDNIRSIVLQIVKDFGHQLRDDVSVEIMLEVNESVHFHNISSAVKDNFGILKKKLNSA